MLAEQGPQDLTWQREAQHLCNLEVVVGLEEGIEELAEMEGVHRAPESEELEQKFHFPKVLHQHPRLRDRQQVFPRFSNNYECKQLSSLNIFCSGKPQGATPRMSQEYQKGFQHCRTSSLHFCQN